MGYKVNDLRAEHRIDATHSDSHERRDLSCSTNSTKNVQECASYSAMLPLKPSVSQQQDCVR